MSQTRLYWTRSLAEVAIAAYVDMHIPPFTVTLYLEDGGSIDLMIEDPTLPTLDDPRFGGGKIRFPAVKESVTIQHSEVTNGDGYPMYHCVFDPPIVVPPGPDFVLDQIVAGLAIQSLEVEHGR